jgi:hypothetical protein
LDAGAESVLRPETAGVIALRASSAEFSNTGSNAIGSESSITTMESFWSMPGTDSGETGSWGGSVEAGTEDDVSVIGAGSVVGSVVGAGSVVGSVVGAGSVVVGSVVGAGSVVVESGVAGSVVESVGAGSLAEVSVEPSAGSVLVEASASVLVASASVLVETSPVERSPELVACASVPVPLEVLPESVEALSLVTASVSAVVTIVPTTSVTPSARASTASQTSDTNTTPSTTANQRATPRGAGALCLKPTAERLLITPRAPPLTTLRTNRSDRGTRSLTDLSMSGVPERTAPAPSRNIEVAP